MALLLVFAVVMKTVPELYATQAVSGKVHGLRVPVKRDFDLAWPFEIAQEQSEGASGVSKAGRIRQVAEGAHSHGTGAQRPPQHLEDLEIGVEHQLSSVGLRGAKRVLGPSPGTGSVLVEHHVPVREDRGVGLCIRNEIVEKGGIHLTQVALHVVLSVNYLSIWQRRGMGGLLDSTNLMSILAAGGLPPAPKTEDRSTLDPLVGGP